MLFQDTFLRLLEGTYFIPVHLTLAARYSMESDLSNIVLENEGIIIIDCDKFPAPIKKSRKRSKGKKQRRAVTVNSVDNNTETLIITQKVEVKKQKIKCVINLNTSKRRNKNKNDQENREKITKSKNKENVLERIVPTCFRLNCKGTIGGKTRCNHRKHIERNQRKRSDHRRHKSHHYSERKQPRNFHSTKSEDRHKPIKTVKDPSLSSISLSPLRNVSTESELSYEDISLDSFTSYCESDLDTLIRRTKKREGQMILSSNFLSDQPRCASTPEPVIEISSDEETLSSSLIDTSIHSQATLLVAPKTDVKAYSPTTAWNSLQHHEKYEEKLENTNINKSPYYCNNNIINISNNKTGIKKEYTDAADIIPYFLANYPCTINCYENNVANNNIIPYSENTKALK